MLTPLTASANTDPVDTVQKAKTFKENPEAVQTEVAKVLDTTKQYVNRVCRLEKFEVQQKEEKQRLPPQKVSMKHNLYFSTNSFPLIFLF